MAPNDPRPHVVLGRILARGGQKEEARLHLETAVGLAKQDSRFRSLEVETQRELERLNSQGATK